MYSYYVIEFVYYIGKYSAYYLGNFQKDNNVKDRIALVRPFLWFKFESTHIGADIGFG